MSGTGDYAKGYAAGLRRAADVTNDYMHTIDPRVVGPTLRTLWFKLRAEVNNPAPTPRVGGQDAPTVRPASVSIAQASRRPDAWQVNCIDCKGAGIYEYALFEGVGSFDRAHAYADWRYGPVAAQEPADAPAPPAEHPGTPEAASEAPGAGSGPFRWLRSPVPYPKSGTRPPDVLQQAFPTSTGEVEWRDVPVVEG